MISKIILAKGIKLDRDYKNVVNYTETQMVNLLSSQTHLVASSNKYSFIRATGSIMSGFTYSECLQSNYMAFQNPDYSNKWFFAWIDDVIYKGEKNTEIRYTIDSWSTWFDYWTAETCLVSREHVSDDTVGLHTIPENLDIGDLIVDREDWINEVGSESYFYLVIGSNYDPSNDTTYAGLGIYADYPQGCMWFAWLVNRNSYASTVNSINQWLRDITIAGHIGEIQFIMALPYQAFNLTGDIDPTSHLVDNGKGKKLDSNVVKSKSGYRTIVGFTPKNNKCLVYPYSFVRITNNLGSYNDYKIEDFLEYNNNELTDNMTFKVRGIPCIGYSGKITPIYYKGLAQNEDESLVLGKYPTFSWNTDAFINWLTQNAVNLASNIAFTSISAIANAGENGANSLASVANMAANTLGQLNKASMLPSTAEGNLNSGDMSFGFNLSRFKMMHMRPKEEYIKRIDDYFTRYGYQVNELKVPNITGRTYWNYVEIAPGEDIGSGTTPTKYMDIINKSAQRGVTIWHDHANIGNFALSNTIVTPTPTP